MVQLRDKAVDTAASTHFLLSTGKVPGIEQSNKDTFLLTGLANSFGALENNLLFEAICAWISKPTTAFHLSLKKKI